MDNPHGTEQDAFSLNKFF